MSTPSDSAASSPSVSARNERALSASTIQLATQNGRGDDQMIDAAVLQRAEQPERDFERDERIGREVEDQRGGGAGEARERKPREQRHGQARAPAGDGDQAADRDAARRRCRRAAPRTRSPAGVRRRSRPRRWPPPPAARRTARARPADCAAGPAGPRRRGPSVAPISAASSVRGSRMSRTMMPAGPSPVNSAAERLRAATARPARPSARRSPSTTISAASARLSRMPLACHC